jgi:hypothetical protein
MAGSSASPSRLMLKLVISLAKSFALIVIVGRKSARGRESGVGNAQARLHVLGGQTAEERDITLAADTGKAHLVTHPLVDDAGEILLTERELLAGAGPFDFGNALFDQFLLARLDREVGLCEGDGVLARIPVLRNQVTGVARERDVIDGPGGATAPSRPFS